jgi:hypothetical protein
MTVLSWSLTDFAIRWGRVKFSDCRFGGLSIGNSVLRAKRIARWHTHCWFPYRIARRRT